jgi:prepilin-type N-terminal cleavage/methylation domain-containing protein
MMFSLKETYRKVCGFTLVEMLIYLAIFTVVSTASIGFLLSLDEFIDQYRIETILYQSGTNSMEQIMLGIRQADEVDLTNTIVNTPASGKLAISHGTSTTIFTLNAGDLDLEIDGVDLGNLIQSDVTASEFTVYYYPLTNGDFVRVRLRLTATVGSMTKSLTLYDGAVIRGAL